MQKTWKEFIGNALKRAERFEDFMRLRMVANCARLEAFLEARNICLEGVASYDACMNWLRESAPEQTRYLFIRYFVCVEIIAQYDAVGLYKKGGSK